jgi:hypothetical protein
VAMTPRLMKDWLVDPRVIYIYIERESARRGVSGQGATPDAMALRERDGEGAVVSAAAVESTDGFIIETWRRAISMSVRLDVESLLA